MTKSLLRALCALLGALLLDACTTAALPRLSVDSAPAGLVAASSATLVPESWISAPVIGDELDSLATWPTEEGRLWVIATAKSTHRLAVYDGETGQRLRAVGGPGRAPGRFDRPNGIAVFGDHAFVSERDNRRVQVLSLPDFKPLLSFGEAELRLPYGLWLHEIGPGEVEVHVTDSFMADFAKSRLPPSSELDQRVRRYRLRFPPPDAGGPGAAPVDIPTVDYQGAYGETEGEGVLHMVESIAGDPVHERVLIADEDRRIGSTLREYSLQGHYRGHSLPTFEGDAEGVALWSCGIDAGYWVAIDQVRPTRFRLFERAGLRPAGVFSGREVANTDGLAIHAGASPGFPAGVLFAVHEDRSLAAFDLGDVARALGLDERCRQ